MKILYKYSISHGNEKCSKNIALKISQIVIIILITTVILLLQFDFKHKGMAHVKII